MKALKIVRLDAVKQPFRYFSFTSPKVVEYFKDKFTYPQLKCGPLSAFDSMNSITTFLKYHPSWLDCKGFLKPYIKCWNVEINFWKGSEKRLWKWSEYYLKRDYMVEPLPNGTLLCSSIKLIEQINLDNVRIILKNKKDIY